MSLDFNVHVDVSVCDGDQMEKAEFIANILEAALGKQPGVHGFDIEVMYQYNSYGGSEPVQLRFRVERNQETWRTGRIVS